MASSDTGGVKPMTITRRVARERERCIGMTDEERKWRAQWLKDQELAPEEPLVTQEYYRKRFNPIRRFYRAPLDALENMLVPKVGDVAATVTRNFIGKVGLAIVAIYTGFYYFKYNKMSWEQRSGWNVMKSRKAVYPGDESYPNYDRRTEGKDYYVNDFDKSPI